MKLFENKLIMLADGSMQIADASFIGCPVIQGHVLSPTRMHNFMNIAVMSDSRRTALI
jgi:hypothetical protein